MHELNNKIVIHDGDDQYKERLLPTEQNVKAKLPAHEIVLDTSKITKTSNNNSVTEETNLPNLIKDNLQSGITVGLVNLSLSISLAVASGSTPGAGIVSGIYSGLVSGLLGGSNFNIIGPTGALSGFIKKLLTKWGQGCLPFCCFFIGLVCFLARLLQMDKYIDLFPVAVTEGFTVGVALILFINQIPPALGMENFNPEHSVYSGGDESKMQNTLIDNLIMDLSNLQAVNYYALTTFLVFLLVTGLVGKRFPKFPVVIIATLLGVLVGYLQSIGVFNADLHTLETKYGNIEFHLFTLPVDFSVIFKLSFYIDCLPIALIAILETLISAKIADKMTKTRFDKNQELIALGTSNIAVGISGGIPVTAALARTSLNIKSGATHKISSFINSLVILLLAYFFFDKFKYLPICVIGSIVCIVALKMVDYDEVIHLYKQDFQSFLLIMLGGVVSLIADPTIGLIVAMIVYFFMFTTPFLNPFYEVIFTKAKNKKGKFIISNLDQHLQDIPVGVKSDKRNFIVYRFIGILNYMNIDYHEKKIIEVMEKEPNVCLILSMRYIYTVDIDTLDSIKLLLENIKSYDNEFFSTHRFILSGITGSQIKTVKDPEWFNSLVNEQLLILSEEFDVEWAHDHENLSHPQHHSESTAIPSHTTYKLEDDEEIDQHSNKASHKQSHNKVDSHINVEKKQSHGSPNKENSTIRSPNRPHYQDVVTHFQEYESDFATDRETDNEKGKITKKTDNFAMTAPKGDNESKEIKETNENKEINDKKDNKDETK